MRASRRNARAEIKKRSRASKDEAGREGREGMGEPEEGIRLPASDYANEPPASFPGVAEPVVEPDSRGASPPVTPLPTRPDDAT